MNRRLNKDPFNWEWIEGNISELEDEFGDKFLGVFLGTIMNLQPSGKLYTFWTSNQSKRDVQRDQAYWNRLDWFARRKGYELMFIDGDAYIFKLPESENVF